MKGFVKDRYEGMTQDEVKHHKENLITNWEKSRDEKASVNCVKYALDREKQSWPRKH